jgi:hypothetical protein
VATIKTCGPSYQVNMLGSNANPKVKKATKLTHQAHISQEQNLKPTNKMLGKT